MKLSRIVSQTLACAAVALLALADGSTAAADAVGFMDKFAHVNGTCIHYQIGGRGSPVVLLHGYAQTGHMWKLTLANLAKTHTVIAPDLRGAGASDEAHAGYDKKNMARDTHELVTGITDQPAAVVGHDIGLMVAYAMTHSTLQAPAKSC